jgi:hypothetical protein
MTEWYSSTANADDPLFPSTSGRPDGSILEKLKAVAYRGQTQLRSLQPDAQAGRRHGDNQPLRRRPVLPPLVPPQISSHLRHAASPGRDRHPDIAAVDGARDLASTMVYLKGARNRDVQARINTGSLASFA